MAKKYEVDPGLYLVAILGVVAIISMLILMVNGITSESLIGEAINFQKMLIFMDSDNDGILDDGDHSKISGDNPCTSGETKLCDDNCPNNVNQLQADADGDSIGQVCDNCPWDVNPYQIDTDNDGLGDHCDNCILVSNENQEDLDNDHIGDVCDNCPYDSNPYQIDTDNDGLGDHCDPKTIPENDQELITER